MHKAYVFDAYGTLFDVHSAVAKFSQQMGGEGASLSNLWRIKQLEYTWVRTSMGAYQDFWQLTEQALDFAMEKHPNVAANFKEKLLDAYMELSCYEEVPRVLTDLKARGLHVAVLSNGSPKMLDAAVKASKLEGLLDAVLSVDELKCFKPERAVYEMATKRFDLLPSEVSFHSSNRWDIAGANRFGFHTVWINRGGEADEYKDFPPHRISRSLEAAF